MMVKIFRPIAALEKSRHGEVEKWLKALGNRQRSTVHFEGETFMAKHLNPLEKEFLVRQFRMSQRTAKEFAALHGINEQSIKKWTKQYEEGGLVIRHATVSR